MKFLINKRLWLYLSIFAIATCSLLWESPSAAAPLKTVPKFTPQPTHTPTPVPMATVAPAIAQTIVEIPLDSSAVAEDSAALLLELEQNPHFVQQGDIVTLQFSVTNQSHEIATNVLLRDSFPPDLKIISCLTQGSIELCQPDTTELQIRWPQLLSSQVVTTNIQLLVSATLPDGAVLENLAVVYSKEIPGQTTGYRLGMPPALVPYFD